MLKEINKRFEYDKKLANVINEYSVKCKCGHTILIINKKGYVICNYCGNLVFKNKKTEFEYRLKERLRNI